ncbi:MAG: carotenoid 1,2-hydratase [Gammaproteobacteria bacterium]|nr:carotenoid 1,2-hydratase [Gammaproteobacteria bacterium]MCI0590380.1 carotenoid 1,2-hydratase [Gammaproteobacteria bacterium]
MARQRFILLIAAALVSTGLIAGLAYSLWSLGDHNLAGEPHVIADALVGENTSGFAQATRTRPFSFPTDYGPHNAYQAEWWYFTGNVVTSLGRPFGFELTFFRVALAPGEPVDKSPWRTNQLYLAHFALTDVDGEKFYAYERVSRGALGLAGARSDSLTIWLEDWSVRSSETRHFPVILSAAEGNIAIELSLEQGKPVVLNGYRGLSQKSSGPGNASYYYSLTRMPTRGTVRIDGETFAVVGTSWMDREWSTSALGPDQIGWDWFALQMSDGQEIMFYRLRRQDGSTDPYSAGTLVTPSGAALQLTHDAVQIEVLDYWKSPRDSTRYPARWRIKVPIERLELEVRPILAQQELNLSVRYWEGAVEFAGTHADEPIHGRGYVELTGYDRHKAANNR